MAQPIPLLRQSQNGSGAGEHKHDDAIRSSLELLQLLHDRGILDLLRGAVGAGDRIVDTLSSAVDTPESLRAIRNFILLTKFFGSIPPEVLNSLVHTVMEGAARKKASALQVCCNYFAGFAAKAVATLWLLPSIFWKAWERDYELRF